MSGRAVAFAATFFVPVVLARVFSQSDFGTYKQLFLVYGTLYLIAQAGMAESLFYFLPSARDGGRYVANAMLFLAVAGLACFLFLHEAGAALAQWLNNPELARYTTPLGVFAALMLASSAFEITMVARARYRLASVSYGVSDVVRAAFFLVPALVFRRIDLLLWSAVVFAAVRLVATLVYVTGTFEAQLRPQAAALGRQLRYTLPFGAAAAMEIAQANLHLYAVSYYVEAATFAIYAVGCLQIPIVDLVTSSAGSVIMVRMARERSARRLSNCLTIWRETVRHLALVLVPVVGVLLVTADRLIVVLFTEQYAAATPIFMIWTLAILPTMFLTDAALRVFAQMRVSRRAECHTPDADRVAPVLGALDVSARRRGPRHAGRDRADQGDRARTRRPGDERQTHRACSVGQRRRHRALRDHRRRSCASRAARSVSWPAAGLVTGGRRLRGCLPPPSVDPRRDDGDKSMCGIAGIVSLTDRTVGLPELRAMCGAMVHRGPNSGGAYLGPRVGLGMRRLSVIDLLHRQPADLERGRFRVGGPQRRDLQLPRAAARARGPGSHLLDRRRHRDHRASLRGVRVNCVDKLRGMYAFALWDARERQLLLARDRIGIKPLYLRHVRWSTDLRLGAQSDPSAS